jgi:4-oxalocrotonate tautomerase
MPNVVIDGPPIKELDAKRTLVREITDVLAKVYGIPAEAFVIVIKENPPDNVSVGGKLLIDRRAGE